MAHIRDLQQASTPKLLFELSWLEADQENLLLVSDLTLSRRIVFSALWNYVNMHVNFVKVKSWIDFSSEQQNEKNLRLENVRLIFTIRLEG